MKLYFAGWQASRRLRELEVIRRAKIKNRCFSFANLHRIPNFPYFISGEKHVCGTYQGSYDACIENGVGVLMDSGVVSFRGYKKRLMELGKSIDTLPTDDAFLEMYAEYCKKHSREWDFFATVDMEPEASSTWNWHNKLEKLGVRATPVFHGDTDAEEWLKRYRDKGYTFIMLGGSYLNRSTNRRGMRSYLDTVFNVGEKLGVTFHGLGMTTPWVMLNYPFTSIDSSWWTRTAGYGSIMQFDEVKERMSILHISPRLSTTKMQDFKHNTRAIERLKCEVREHGFDLDKLRDDFVERHVYNALSMLKLLAAASKRQRTQWEVLV